MSGPSDMFLALLEDDGGADRHPVEQIDPNIDGSSLTNEEIAYIEKSLQSNPERFESQVNAVKKHSTIKDAMVLDIGCGGGIFLSKLKEAGAQVTGIELSDTRAYYAKSKHGHAVTLGANVQPLAISGALLPEKSG